MAPGPHGDVCDMVVQIQGPGETERRWKMNKVFAIALMLFGLVLMTSCTLVSELADSSGCLVSEGGPIPGVSSGKVIVCRSGKDLATVRLIVEDNAVAIMIDHAKQEGLTIR